jgi:hypothetical protein
MGIFRAAATVCPRMMFRAMATGIRIRVRVVNWVVIEALAPVWMRSSRR